MFIASAGDPSIAKYEPRGCLNIHAPPPPMPSEWRRTSTQCKSNTILMYVFRMIVFSGAPPTIKKGREPANAKHIGFRRYRYAVLGPVVALQVSLTAQTMQMEMWFCFKNTRRGPSQSWTQCQLQWMQGHS